MPVFILAQVFAETVFSYWGGNRCQGWEFFFGLVPRVAFSTQPWAGGNCPLWGKERLQRQPLSRCSLRAEG